jgi:uncharacterized protein (TIGR03067 family)
MKEKMFVVFQKDEIRIFVEGTRSEQGAKFQLDPQQDPKHINFVESTADREWERGLLWLKLFKSWKMQDGVPVAADSKVEGIYKLDGDNLTVCWRTTKAKDLLPAGGATKELTVRPTLFQSVLYYHQFLFVLKRVPAGA